MYLHLYFVWRQCIGCTLRLRRHLSLMLTCMRNTLHSLPSLLFVQFRRQSLLHHLLYTALLVRGEPFLKTIPQNSPFSNRTRDVNSCRRLAFWRRCTWIGSSVDESWKSLPLCFSLTRWPRRRTDRRSSIAPSLNITFSPPPNSTITSHSKSWDGEDQEGKGRI